MKKAASGAGLSEEGQLPDKEEEYLPNTDPWFPGNEEYLATWLRSRKTAALICWSMSM